MFIEVNVSPGENYAEPLTLMFNSLNDPLPVTWVWTQNRDVVEVMCAITGWSAQGPCPAYAVLVEESGEGTALLIYGGDEGLRLKPLENGEEWDVTSPRQWGEPCLLLPQTTEVG